MKIYTKTGDDGSTGLIGGSRVPKSDDRIDCYGTVDELNASLGLAAADAEAAIRDSLIRIQNELFVIGSYLAAPDPDETGEPVAAKFGLPPMQADSIGRLEREIDACETTLTPLTQFILPGGTPTAARLHLARTICRRAERLLVRSAMERSVEPMIFAYLNRLSDWLFVQARRVNHHAKIQDTPWRK